MNLLNKLQNKISNSFSNFRKIEKDQSGQILVIFLLVLVVGLAITLSIASRTITDVRQTTTSDDSNKAYFAAEAGVEAGLKRVEGGVTGGFSVSFDTANNSNSNVAVTGIGPINTGTVFSFPDKMVADDVAQISLLTDFNNLSGGGFANSDTIKVYWDDGNNPLTGPNVPAMEVTVAGYSGGNWTIAKYAFDANAGSRNNFFCSSPLSQAPVTKTDQNNISQSYKYTATITFNNGACTTGSNNDNLAFAPVLARFRLLYNTTAVPVAVEGVSKALPAQGNVITSVGTTPSGVTRKLQVVRLYPALPSIFDYVLFNGGSTPLTK